MSRPRRVSRIPAIHDAEHTSIEVRKNQRVHEDLSIQIVGDGFVASQVVRSGTWMIGRGRDADIPISAPSVSRQHAVLRIGRRITVEDAGSRNGTFVDGQRVLGREVAIEVNGEFSVGGVIVRLREAPQTDRGTVVSMGRFTETLDELCRESLEKSPVLVRVRLSSSARSADTGLVHLPVHQAPFAGLLEEAATPGDLVACYDHHDAILLIQDAEAEALGARLGRIRELAAAFGWPIDVATARPGTDGAWAHELLHTLAEKLTAGISTDSYIGSSDRDRLQALIERVAGGAINVLVTGETGVGKEVMAERIHTLSERCKGPLLRLNCGALTETLLESELFGHEKGAFTGATQTKPGLLETASGGTVFLDEIGDLPLSLQVKLLRVIEERAVRRVGGLKPQPIDVRFIAATHKDLRKCVAEGTFREDLYYRINGITIPIAPLRERRNEIGPLVRKFVSQAIRDQGRASTPVVSAEAQALIEAYSWPGNIRQLRNAVERAVLLCGGARITSDHLPDELKAPQRAAFVPAKTEEVRSPAQLSYQLDLEDDGFDLRRELGAFEKQAIVSALELVGGNQTRAASLLRIPRRTLIARLSQYGIPRPRKP